MFLRLVCILKLEGLLQGYVKWKNTVTGNVNFLTQNVGPWICYMQLCYNGLHSTHCPMKRHLKKMIIQCAVNFSVEHSGASTLPYGAIFGVFKKMKKLSFFLLDTQTLKAKFPRLMNILIHSSTNSLFSLMYWPSIKKGACL